MASRKRKHRSRRTAMYRLMMTTGAPFFLVVPAITYVVSQAVSIVLKKMIVENAEAAGIATRFVKTYMPYTQASWLYFGPGGLPGGGINLTWIAFFLSIALVGFILGKLPYPKVHFQVTMREEDVDQNLSKQFGVWQGAWVRSLWLLVMIGIIALFWQDISNIPTMLDIALNSNFPPMVVGNS